MKYELSLRELVEDWLDMARHAPRNSNDGGIFTVTLTVPIRLLSALERFSERALEENSDRAEQ